MQDKEPDRLKHLFFRHDSMERCDPLAMHSIHILFRKFDRCHYRGER